MQISIKRVLENVLTSNRLVKNLLKNYCSAKLRLVIDAKKGKGKAVTDTETLKICTEKNMIWIKSNINFYILESDVKGKTLNYNGNKIYQVPENCQFCTVVDLLAWSTIRSTSDRKSSTRSNCLADETSTNPLQRNGNKGVKEKW